MKQFFTAAAVALVLSLGSASAQTKLGYFSLDNMVALMPETQKLDSVLEQYQKDSLSPQLRLDVEQFQYKDSILTKTDTSATPKSILAQYKQDRENHLFRINNFQQISQQLTQQKQEEFLQPIYAKVYEALRAVSKEKGYTHVFNQEAFLVAPDGDNLLPAVAAKLKVKLPTQNAPAPAGGGARPPATRPNN